jgi:N-acetylglucosaminyl-diphospho-decaprenol L-rhamnosyltransferase
LVDSAPDDGRIRVVNREPIDVLIVIVNYRSARLTLRALASLRGELGHPDLRLRAVVVENDSGDSALLSKAIGEEFSDFVELAVSPRNGGFGAGNNFGLAHATAHGLRPKYVHFLNPDTEIRPGAVRALVDFMEAHPRAGLIGGSFEHDDGTPWRIAFRFPSVASELVDAARLGLLHKLLPEAAVALPMAEREAEIDWPSGASMMMRRAVLGTVGGFDESFFLYFEEIDLCRRVKAAGWECWYVPASCVMHVRGQSTGVTALDQRPKRLPAYWFESRRRYFMKHHGPRYAAIADLASLVGNGVGMAKAYLKRDTRELVPHLLRDLVAQSALLPRNRQRVLPDHIWHWPAD